ncbi:MAG TPA: TlpA disulfide reductase family protein [Sphingobacterium sp.]|nr:TlpA disulfide reductase family protein [Sphingobacterium sp.]
MGHKFVDFTAPDIQGNIFRLSELIKGKIALINLWATWCGPCITKSKTMLPLYAAYKDKGFTIIGVAGEHKNTDNLIKFLEREKWPWINLVDLDKKEKIWQKYSADHKSGTFFLIDRQGSIVAIDPNADEIKAILEKQLN